MAVFTTRDGLALGSKTPVSILQELLQKRGLTPHYELIYNGVGTQDPLFKFRVSAEEETAIGDGKSKKEAKHDAAATLLKRLLSKESVTESREEERKEEVDIASPYTNALKTNYVGMLDEICVANKIPFATYELVMEEGPPHARIFTMKCVLSSISEEAVARTKKQAKHLAAQKMVEKVTAVLGARFVTDVENGEKGEETISDREKIKNGTFQHDLAVKVKDLHNVFHVRLDEQPLPQVFKELPEKEEGFYERLENPVEFLETIVDALEGVLTTNHVTREEFEMSLRELAKLMKDSEISGDSEVDRSSEDETETKDVVKENRSQNPSRGNYILPDFPISDDEEESKTENVALSAVQLKEDVASDRGEKVHTSDTENSDIWSFIKVEVPLGRWEFAGRGPTDSEALDDAARKAIKFLRIMAIPPPDNY